MTNLVRAETVKPAPSILEQLRHEVYTLGTAIRQVSSESGMPETTVKSILMGNNVEKSTEARLIAYLKALSRNEFAAVRSLRKYEKGALSGKLKTLDRRYYAINKELWREYRRTCMHPDDFAKLSRVDKLIQLNRDDRNAKLLLMKKYEGFIATNRVWLADGWNYWRWKRKLKDLMGESFG